MRFKDITRRGLFGIGATGTVGPTSWPLVGRHDVALASDFLLFRPLIGRAGHLQAAWLLGGQK